jgi:alpha-tubulin suppressor-like RCC1 family protein
MALANEQSHSKGLGPVGFFNPLLYKIGASDVYPTCFNDLGGNNQQSTCSPVCGDSCRPATCAASCFPQLIPGTCFHYSPINYPAAGTPQYCTNERYDLPTGWGTPKCGLINQLASTTPDPSQAVSVGGRHTCALRGDGSVWCWGQNSFAQLGDGTTTESLFPIPTSLSGATGIASGLVHTCAVGGSDGSVWCWGWNVYGQFGDGYFDDSISGTGPKYKSPYQIPDLNGVKAIVAGDKHTCMLMDVDGSIKCTGNNYFAQLGAGNVNDSPSPLNVVDAGGSVLSHFTAISAAKYRTCGIHSPTGKVWCWGQASYGDTAYQALDYHAVMMPLDYTAIAVTVGGDHACQLVNNGSVWCWGNNTTGQLGNAAQYNNTTGPKSTLTPVKVDGVDDAIAIAATPAASCAVVSGGRVKCWGLRIEGGSTTISPSPVDVPFLKDVKSLAGGGYGSGLGATCSLSNQAISCWGLNSYGQVGNGTTVDQEVPSTVRFF